jgi:photosystem II stability/assembly factor-like uncharacterized protein
VSRALQRVLVAVTSLAVLVAPFALGGSVAHALCGTPYGAWRVQGLPTFKEGPKRLAAYLVDPAAPNRILITNGTSVMRSTDSGCSYKHVFALPDTPNAESQATAANSQILSIEIFESNRERVLLMIEEQGPQGARPHIVRTDDFGTTWSTGDVGLPLHGAPQALVVPPTEPALAYLAIDVGGGSIDLLFASTDGGATWTLRSNPAALTPSMGIDGLTVDPIVPSSLWAWGTGGLYHSTDGGASFPAVPEFVGSPVSTVDVFHAGAKKARIAAFRPLTSDAQVSQNGGNTWLTVATPNEVDSVAHGDTSGEVFISARGQVFGYHQPTFSWLNVQAPLGGLTDVATDRAGVVYARHNTALLAYSGRAFVPTQLTDDIFDVPLVNPPESLQRRPPTLGPDRRKIVLDPGASRKVSYRLDLPSRPLPLNIFFLLDTSDSMGATIGDLADSVADIVNQLTAEKIALKVGIGAFRAYPDKTPPDPPCDGSQQVGARCEKNYVYERVLDIQPPGPLVTQALETLESDAGGFYKSHLGALYQLATGAGQDLLPPGPLGHDVPRGLQANFDDNSLRVVIHATDEAFGDDVPRESGPGGVNTQPPPPEIPEFGEIDAAFEAKNIIQVGLSIGKAPKKDLERVAGDTGALAPAGGVDCGKGHVIPAGGPLVCPVQRNNLDQSHNLVPAIVNLLQAVPNSTDVALEVDGNQRVVQKVTPDLHRDIVLQVANGLPFQVTYRCPLDLAGERFKMRLGARGDAGRMLDSAVTDVVCRAKPKVPPIVPPIAAVLGIVVPPPPPPPPPVNVTSASQAQSQAQAQTGAAFQEEEQPQVAVAAAYREAMQVEDAYAYEMVAYQGRKEPVSPYLTLGAGAVIASMAYAAQAIARQKSQLANQQQRRR